jgi:hypothetical protein
MSIWTPPPTDAQRAASKQSVRFSLFFVLIAVMAGGGLFFVEGWPEWMGYLGGFSGIVGWLFFVRSREDLAPPGNGPFGGTD